MKFGKTMRGFLSHKTFLGTNKQISKKKTLLHPKLIFFVYNAIHPH